MSKKIRIRIRDFYKDAIGEITDVIQKFNNTIAELLQSVQTAIVDVEKTSENGRLIQESMDLVSVMAEKVEGVIKETNSILS